MMFDRQFTDEYIKKKWPKITLPLANTRKNDPFVPGIVDEGSITIDEKSGTHDHKVRNTLCVIGLGTLLLCLVGAAIITIALLADQRTDKTDYVKVNMTVAINQTFTPELNDTESTEYKTFATKFCSEMENVYASKSSSVDGYFGCKVIQLTDGSIIVNYVIYFISTTNQQVTTDTISTTLITHLTVSGTQLGSLVVITSTIIVHDVATETLESPPAVDKIATTTTIKSTIETTTKENVPSTETTPASETVQQTEATTLKTMQSTAETTSLTISSTKETTPNTQSTTEISTPFISSTEETTPKNMQSTTDNSTPTITSTGDTTSKTMQSTTETTTRLITSPGETTPKTVQSTTETTTPSISSTADTTPKTVQSTTETTTPSISSTDETTQKNMQSTTKTATPTMSSTEKTTPKTIQSTTDTTTPLITAADETTPKNMQSTTETTNPSILSTDDTTPKNMQSTTKTTTPSISSTEKTTPKIMQSTTESTNPSILSTDETTPKNMQSTTKTTTPSISSTEKTTPKSMQSKISTPSISPTEEIPQNTMQSTKETTISSISTTLEPMTNPSTDQVSEETTTQQTTFKITEGTSTTTKESTQAETSTTQEKISNKDATITTPVIVTSPSIASTLKDTSKSSTTYKTPEMTTSSVTAKPADESTTSVATMLNDKTTTTSITQSTTKTVTVTDYVTPTTIDVTTRTTHKPFLSETTSAVSSAKTEVQSTITQNKETTTFIAMTDQTYASVKVSTMDDTTSRSTALPEDMTSTTTQDETTVSTSRMDTSSDKTSCPAGKPTLTLNADQVIDLVFPDGNYYRSTGTHTCEGLIGEPPARLEIDITYDNGTSFKQIPNSSIDLSRTNTSDECSTKETISFGLKFSLDMDGARLRCRVSDSSTDFTLSDELSLIPRNICSCGVSDSYRGHPSNCKVQVYCVEDKGVMYARGIACTSNQCRNSITGVCDTDCSDTVCNETVPSDFCTTPAPPTTTPAPSPYIVCTDTIALINSGSAVITCYLNDTATFTVMNVTYLNLGATDVQQIALIDDSNSITMFAMEDIVSISMSNNIINITILNPSCTNEGTFAVVTDINGESVKDHGKLSVISKPNGDATLQLHPDQIAGLGSYRTWLLHSCIINVGYPPGEISIEMMKQDDAGFTKLNVHFHTSNDDLDNTTCSITRTVKFGFVFTADMDKATMRCSVTHDLFPEDPFVYSNNETVSLIPIDFCKNNTDSQSYHPHQTNCHSFIQCEGDVTYGQPCPSSLCFGVTETNGCNFCDQAICPADITTTPVPESSTFASSIEETTTPEPMSLIDVFCNSSTVTWNSGPVDMVCKLNTTDFNVLNVTFRSPRQAIPTVISQIQSNGNINDLIQDDGVTVSHVGQLVTISILNASCSSGDFYGLVAVDIHGKAEGQAEGKLIVGSIPNDAVLTLHPDQNADLAYRRWLLHYCEADVGYPPGEIQIEILNQGEAEFTVLNVDIVTSNDNIGSCSLTKKVEFGIDFTANMDKATIRCSVKSTLYPENPVIYSNNDTVSLIPSDFCEGHNASYNPHPTNCNYYIQCLGDIEYGKKCQTSLCFGITQTEGCDHCFNAVCPSDITTTAKPETTVPVPSIDVSCTDSSVLLNSGPTDIVCVVNTTSFSMINVTFTKSSGVDPSLISRIEGDGRVIYTNFSDHIVVQYISSTVTITIQNVSCPYEGFYGVAVDSGNGLTGRKEGELSVTAKPSGPLDFKLHPEQIAGLNTVRSTKLHSCTGGVGNPGGKIGVEILLDGDDNFQTYEPSFKSITDTHENCTITREFKFWIAFTAAMNNATIKCKITNDKYQTDPPINSKNETLALVPHDFCNRNYNGTNRYHHPTDCNRYVTCVEKVGYVQACKQSLCFDPTIGACNFCETVNSCP
ncbi:serine-rich adhesin for platelets-like isoform X2 [Mytilus californianus]|uniref:serine-rich adhesin for platelets-like isoform X2 n=1 Tax=Mytilus californianus TaxID=6549 RepID=UPI0022482E83|nr:serine-rich adhesin for platelets-like isoform X2 [Mytilus californianus]